MCFKKLYRGCAHYLSTQYKSRQTLVDITLLYLSTFIHNQELRFRGIYAETVVRCFTQTFIYIICIQIHLTLKQNTPRIEIENNSGPRTDPRGISSFTNNVNEDLKVFITDWCLLASTANALLGNPKNLKRFVHEKSLLSVSKACQ